MYVGVDLGATNVRAAVADETGRIVGNARAPTPDGPTGEAVTDGVVAVVREACAEAGIAPRSVAGAGIGAIGRLDAAAGTAAIPANLAGDPGPIPLVEPLAALLEVDDDAMILRSDTLMGAIGEWRCAHPDVANLVYLTISSGIGAGVIADGAPLRGRNGNAGEVGHLTVDADGIVPCGCGATGHWEAYCSGNNVPRFARALAEREPEPVDTALPLEDPDFTAADVFAHAGSDPFADRVLERVAAFNVRGVANVVNAYAPSVVSVGGAVALENPDHVLEPIRERLPRHVVVDVPDLVRSERGERAVLEGALASAVPDGPGVDPGA